MIVLSPTQKINTIRIIYSGLSCGSNRQDFTLVL